MSEQNSKKVTLPKEVAEAVEELRSKYGTNFSVIHQVHGAFSAEPQMTVKRWALDQNDGFDTLMSAIVYGYTVEQTPEEKLARFYANAKQDTDDEDFGKGYIAGYTDGIMTTLNTLGITIEGINEGGDAK